MTRKELTMCTVPLNGCARCNWWRHRKHSPWGRCILLSEKRWYQAPPCDEYEKDIIAPDKLPLYV